MLKQTELVQIQRMDNLLLVADLKSRNTVTYNKNIRLRKIYEILVRNIS